MVVHNLVLVAKRSGRCRLTRWFGWPCYLVQPRPGENGWAWACAKYSAPLAPLLPAPYIPCSPGSLTSLWAEKWLMTAVSLCHAERSAVYFHVLTEIIT